MNIVRVVLDSQKLVLKILSSTVSFPGNFSKIFPMIRLAVNSPSSVKKKLKKKQIIYLSIQSKKKKLLP